MIHSEYFPSTQMSIVETELCDLCCRAAGVQYCLNCEQYLCEWCKGVHKRKLNSTEHEFRKSSEIAKKTPLQCKEHDEDFSSVCMNCELPVCPKCITEKHNDHALNSMSSSLASLKNDVVKNLQDKTNLLTKNIKDIEEGITIFDVETKSILNEIREEGNKFKTMIDELIEKTISSINDKVKKEKEKLTKLLIDSEYKIIHSEKLEARITELVQTTRDFPLIQKLKELNNDIAKLIVTPVPDFPNISYSSKTVSETQIIKLLGAYNFRYVYVFIKN